MSASLLDVVVIAVYLVGITAFGIRVGYRRDASTDQYFLANKSLGWFTVGAAVFLLAVLWTIFTTREHPPEDMEAIPDAQPRREPLKVRE